MQVPAQLDRHLAGWHAALARESGPAAMTWRDLAVGSWSVTWNLGPGWEDLFLASYGVEPDDRRMAFYRLLYDLAS